MHKRVYSLLLSVVALSQAKAQTPIYNQTTLQSPASFNISGAAQSSTILTTIGTSAGGEAHIQLFNGTGNNAANLRWQQVLMGAETPANAGADFRLLRYSNTGTLLGNGLTIERATGNIIVNQLTAANGSKIQGTGSTSNQSYLQFMQNDNTTREGFIGIGSSTLKDMYLVSDNGNVNLQPKPGGGLLQIAPTQVLNTTGGLLLANATSNQISFKAVAAAPPSFSTRSAGTKIILWDTPVSATTAGWGIGIEDFHMWLGLPTSDANQGFKFYGGTTQIARIDGTGNSEWNGQGRFKGWLTGTAATGPAAEIGIAGGMAYLIGFNRTTNNYTPLKLSGGSTNTNQTVITVNEQGVSIANNTPQLPIRLMVNGGITARNLKITQTGWADYVFRPDYPLRPLAEVAAYIDTHQHLPGIPDAATVAKEGIEVGDINKRLLEKIEELTLYLIEQDKKIKALEAWKAQQEKQH
ncbi:hypothetical protein [Chitinophaga nivalis]|uniref:Uncharacterized protein n=1 Tax=Chitinophaga nivalis TaxID=2991709 RepID=A0ABT3IWG7_9BACT|nr:hypothetical protein [Chitinophaga nivalis]MCW3462067.1 hypothetical protein [Chitinophaga nivalis]MCW3488241.1 hypothetical protein [Chitinophaga nivalis]